jgi:hypothetical protein
LASFIVGELDFLEVVFMRLTPFAADAQRLLWLLLLISWVSGCAAGPWKKHVMYSKNGTVLYAEHEERDQRVVPKGFAHPVQVSTETVGAILAQIVYKHRPLIGKNEDLLLFDEREVADFTLPMQLALGGLTPDQRLRFLVVKNTWASVLTGPKATSGVIFVETEGMLNVALDRIRESVTIGEGGDPSDVSFPYDPTEYRRADPLIPFRGTKLHVDAKSNQRFPRWLEVELAEVRSPDGVPEPAPDSPAAVATPGTAAATGSTTATSTSSSPQGRPPPASAAETSEETEEERYSRLKEKLETLGRLKTEGILTEEQYQKQFEKIMSEL